MDLKEKFNASGPLKKIAAGVGVLVVAFAALWLGSSTSGGGPSNGGDKLFYSVDDGATWFEDSADLVPPFDHNGKPACQVFVYSVDGGKSQFAGYLQRFNAAAKKQLNQNANTPRSIGGMEVKKPGPKESWVARNTKAGVDVVNVKGPGGQGEIELVTP